MKRSSPKLVSVALVLASSSFAVESLAQTASPPPPAPPPPAKVTPAPEPPLSAPSAQPTAPTTAAPATQLVTKTQPMPLPPPVEAPPPPPAPKVEASPEVQLGYDPLGSAGGRAAGLAPQHVRAGDFMDTRLAWTFGDDDFLHPTGELIPLSPTFNIGDRGQYRLFFDNLNSRATGRENWTHLALYKKMPGFLPHLTTEAAVVLRFDLSALAANNGALNQALYDAGSFLRVFYNTGAKPTEGVSATFFPLDTDRMRVGYLYNISWGGTNGYINESIFPVSRMQGSSPGMKLQYDSDKFYAWGGFKVAMLTQPQQILNAGGTNDVTTVQISEANYGFLGGVGADVTEHFHTDVSGGFFEQGKSDQPEVRGQLNYTYGASARLVVHENMPVPQSVDFKLYRNDPTSPMVIFSPDLYKPGHYAWNVNAEASLMGQRLEDFNNPTQMRDVPLWALAIQGVYVNNYTRLSVTGITRNLGFVERNTLGGLFPNETMPSEAKSDPEMFGSFAIDQYIPSLHLTPGFGGGVQLPSTLSSQFSTTGAPAGSTVVVRQAGDVSILPYQRSRSPIGQARITLRYDVSEMLKAYVWMQYVYDNNGTLLVTDPTEGTASIRVMQSPSRLGAAFMMQARF